VYGIGLVVNLPNCCCTGCVFTLRRKWQHYYAKSVSGNFTTSKIVVIVTIRFHADPPSH
jgi:hypothetical protein